MVAIKQCTKCGVEYPSTHEFFSPDRRNKNGLQARCKTCYRHLAVKNYAETPEKYRERSLNFYYENSSEILHQKKQRRIENPNAARERDRKWREANPEKVRAKEQKWREANPERVREQSRRYRANNPEKVSEWNQNFKKRHPEKTRESNRIYRENNIEKVRARKRNYYEANAEKAREYSREWQIRNPTKVALSRQKRRARKRGLPDTLTQQDWFNAVNYWQSCCAYCGKHSYKPTLDHYIALNDLNCPGTTLNNVIPACLSCNVSKGDREAHIWLSFKFGESKGKAIQLRILEYFNSIQNE